MGCQRNELKTKLIEVEDELAHYRPRSVLMLALSCDILHVCFRNFKAKKCILWSASTKFEQNKLVDIYLYRYTSQVSKLDINRSCFPPKFSFIILIIESSINFIKMAAYDLVWLFLTFLVLQYSLRSETRTK